jgi:Domain of unknown function (DUF4136)
MKGEPMGKRMALLLLFVLLGYGFAAAQDVSYDYDQTADFSKFKTYKWAAVEGAMYPNEIADKNIRAALDAELAKKGLTKTETNPDLLVGYQVAVDKEKQIDTWGSGHWYWGGGGMQSTTVSTINVGTLVLDMYDPAKKDLVWRGTATKTLNPKNSPEKKQKNLEKAMAKMMKNYPPTGKKK